MQETDDHTTTLAAIKSQLRQFVRERDWEQYHFPKVWPSACRLKLWNCWNTFASAATTR